MTSVCSISSISGCERTTCGEAADQRRAGAVASGVNDPGPGVGGLEPEPEPPVGSAIEPSAQSEKLVNPVRGLHL